MMENAEKSYRKFLIEELSRRKRLKPAYSLRAFARDLGISPPRLSEVLRGKEGISEKTADKIAQKLKLKSRQKRQWLAMVQSEAARSRVLKEEARKELAKLEAQKDEILLSEDQFFFIAEWWMPAILEIMALDGFESSVNWISNRLGVSKSMVEEGLLRLERLGFIDRTPEAWTVVPQSLSIGGDIPNSAIRKFHRQVINHGLASLLRDSPTEREFNSVILAIDSKRMDEFKERLRSVFDEFTTFADSQGKDKLYGLSIQFFPVSTGSLSKKGDHHDRET